MTLSAPAKKLLSEQPELVKGLIESYQYHSFQFYKKHTTKHGDTEIMWSWPGDVWDDFVQKATKPICPHCGIPTDGTSNDQCYKAPQRDWEILSFRMKSCNYSGYHESTLRGNGKYLNGSDGQKGQYDLAEVLKNKDWKIHSVKRLSDGEVFTVGDLIDIGTIESFSLNNEFSTGLVAICTNTNKSSIDSARKSKKPLLTTYDNVEIFEGERIFGVLPKGHWQTNYWNGEGVKASRLSNFASTAWLWFSNKHAAEEYILFNKPCLSVNDILARYCLDKSEKENVIELAKSKQKT